MHMTSKRTKTSEQVIAALQELNVNIFLLCNQCVSINNGDIVIEAVKNHQSNKSIPNNNEVLTSLVTETIERKINKKLKVSVVPTKGPQELSSEKKRSITSD